MARKAVAARRCSIRFACQAFSISQTCYRYQAKLKHEEAVIADWLVRLTHNQRNWGFGLCYLYLRNVKTVQEKRRTPLSDSGTSVGQNIHRDSAGSPGTAG